MELTTACLLMTDVEGSTRLWETEPRMAEWVSRLDEIVDDSVRSSGGRLLKNRGEGDSHFAVFSTPSAAVGAAIQIQKEISSVSPLKVRIAIHAGEVLPRAEDLYGPTVNRCARLRSIAHGGQVILSRAAREMIGSRSSYLLIDHGPQQLKDLETPEQVYELKLSETVFPPLRSLDRKRHNLPIQNTSFFGRANELADLSKLVAQQRLITLGGPGGSGKTRLALQLLAEVVDEYPDGVWYVDLVSASENGVVSRVAETLAVRPSPHLDLLASVKQELQHRRCVVLFDNCEHVLADARHAIKAILEGCPEVRVVSTSREELGLGAEWFYDILGLRYPAEAISDPRKLRDYDAIVLFEERAAQRDRSFAISKQNAEPVLSICQIYEGMPLAIEIAASHVRYLGLRELHRMVRLDPLSIEMRASSEETRHRSIEKAMEWSYGLLGPAEGSFLCELSIFEGSWTIDAAEAIASVGGIVGHLETLVAKSLVVPLAVGGARRYKLLETIRVFAKKRLADRSALEQRYATYYAELVESAAQSNPSLSDLASEEYPHIVNALGHLETADPPRFLRLIGLMRAFWFRRGMLDDGKLFMARAVNLISPADPDFGKLANAYGIFLWQSGDLSAANSALESALIHEISDRDRQSILLNLGNIASDSGDFSKAISWFQQAQDYLPKSDSEGLLTSLHHNIGVCQRRLGLWNEARRSFESAIAFGKSEKPAAYFSSIISLADILLGEDQIEGAQPLMRILSENLDWHVADLAGEYLTFALYLAKKQCLELSALFLGAAQREISVPRKLASIESTSQLQKIAGILETQLSVEQLGEYLARGKMLKPEQLRSYEAEAVLQGETN